MPPVSLPPSAARGHVWTDSIATRVIAPAPTRTGGRPRSRPLEGDTHDLVGGRPEPVLVDLLAAEEVVALEPAGDGVLDRARDEHHPGGHRPRVGIEPRVVDADRPPVL